MVRVPKADSTAPAIPRLAPKPGVAANGYHSTAKAAAGAVILYLGKARDATSLYVRSRRRPRNPSDRSSPVRCCPGVGASADSPLSGLAGVSPSSLWALEALAAGWGGLGGGGSAGGGAGGSAGVLTGSAGTGSSCLF